MDDRNMRELVQKTSDALETLDIHVWDANVFVYDFHGYTYENYSMLVDAVKQGRAMAYVEIDAMLGDKVWELIETGNS
jgi:hypothetical protein